MRGDDPANHAFRADKGGRPASSPDAGRPTRSAFPQSHAAVQRTRLAKSPSAAHIDRMESGPSEIAVSRWLAGVGAIVTALSVGYIAHYDFGFSRQEIRTQAVIGAAIIGLLMATEYLGKKLRKPK
jgi:hypothetical protein